MDLRTPELPGRHPLSRDADPRAEGRPGAVPQRLPGRHWQ